MMDLKRGFLILSFSMVSVIALLYGIDPAWFARSFLGIADLSLDFAHILRAVMGLYLALGIFWLLCALTNKHKNTAVLTTIVFAGGLFAGRLLSLAADGIPSPLLAFYTALELAIVPIGWWIYKRPD
jgi:hypothetical protein